ncbi:MAG: RagB/SusD family nutrient uptake outer membrane protein [Bacteroidales bacterium]|nr:RagB/SusD family nutrient uptake outer membrane protein [Bacteroidales bacterium]
MKTTKKTIILFALVAIFTTSCSEDFLRPPMPDILEEEQSLRTAQDIQNAVVGIYASLSNLNFLGRNGLSIADVMGDLAGFYGGNNNGFINNFERYTFQLGMGDLAGLWSVPYTTIDRAARAIRAGRRILDEGGLTAREQGIINLSLGQAYGLKAFTHFFLVNYFALPYTYQPNSPGIILVDEEPLTVLSEIHRATVAETYALILRDIATAKKHFEASTGAVFPANQKFFMNHAAIYALEARVHLFMENWSGALAAAQTALNISGATVVSNENYITMWYINTTNTVEDIFTLNFTSGTIGNVNATMGMLWGNFGAAMYVNAIERLFEPTDIRLGLFEDKATPVPNIAKRMRKYPNANSVNNTPIFRASEMYLIIAEAQAQMGTDIAAAQNALFNVAQRDTAITEASQLPDNPTDLLAFIADERGRELTGEGHRWLDLRRRGDLMTRPVGLGTFTDLPVWRTVIPIPQAEINASGIEQNPSWAWIDAYRN